VKSFDDAYEVVPDGWLTRPEAELLWAAADTTSGPILEVGLYRGRSTVLLSALGRPMYCVDPFDGFDSDLSGDEVSAIWMDNMDSRGIENVCLYRERIEDWVARKVGFAYLDGDHTYEGTAAQIDKALEASAGGICVHDYTSPPVMQAVADSILVVVEIRGELAKCTV